MIALVLELAGCLLLAAFFIWLLLYCLRIGSVGAGRSVVWRRDARRDQQPIRFWTGIVALAIGAASMIFLFFDAIWAMLRP
jgi:hypothetical protein